MSSTFLQAVACVTAVLLNGLAQRFSGKESTCNAGDLGSIPGSGRSPGEGNGNPLQYSCLENPMDRGAWRAADHRVAKNQTLLSIHALRLTHAPILHIQSHFVSPSIHWWTLELLFLLAIVIPLWTWVHRYLSPYFQFFGVQRIVPLQLLFFFFLAVPGLHCSTQDLHCSMQTLTCGMWDLVLLPGIKPRPHALEAQSLSHWTTWEDPLVNYFLTWYTISVKRLLR